MTGYRCAQDHHILRLGELIALPGNYGSGAGGCDLGRSDSATGYGRAPQGGLGGDGRRGRLTSDDGICNRDGSTQ